MADMQGKIQVELGAEGKPVIVTNDKGVHHLCDLLLTQGNRHHHAILSHHAEAVILQPANLTIIQAIYQVPKQYPIEALGG